MRSRFLHLSFKSTAVRYSMAGKPSFLISAHFPPPHRWTPSTSASASSSAHGLWCLLRRPFTPTKSRPRAVALPPPARPRWTPPPAPVVFRLFTGLSSPSCWSSESLKLPPLRFLLPLKSVRDSKDPLRFLRRAAWAWVCAFAPLPPATESDLLIECLLTLESVPPVPKKSVCVPAEISVNGDESPASSLPEYISEYTSPEPASSWQNSSGSGSRASSPYLPSIAASRRTSHWRLFDMVSLPKFCWYFSRKRAMDPPSRSRVVSKSKVCHESLKHTSPRGGCSTAVFESSALSECVRTRF
mmetsp:Transcript_7874/g.29486  ORF Transcript_7874/g.29486 Transcript_7874/m.29486 type:complete len:300 (+) Transcript_7874:1652-2551(+)